MAITSNDIKLMQSERLTEDSNGGGQMTGLPVIDGDINNLFEDISRVDRTYGDVSLRKAFLKVDTATADLYLDSHAILSAQPADPNVSGLLFTTKDFYDQRSSARQRIESFVVAGPVTGLSLRGTQLQGQKSLIVYTPAVNSAKAPEVGETYMLQYKQDINTRQFVKVLNVQQSVERFTYGINNGDIRTFTATQYILELSSELKQDYPAQDPNPMPSNDSKLYSTQPATSANYYGTTKLLQSAEAGATSVRVADTFAPIIPTASSETPVIDQRPGGFVSQIIPASTESISLSVAISANTQSTLPTGVVPGSISFTAGATAYVDKGGKFLNSSGAEGSLAGSAIDYRTGLITWGGSITESVNFTYLPGTLRQQLPSTGKIEIDETNRNFNYVLSIEPAPAPTTFNASYQYLGKWYELNDDGTGALVGDGSGQINYETGSIVLTLQAQPDPNSVIFYRWTDGRMYNSVVAEAYDSTTPATIYLNNKMVVPGSVTMSWTSGTAKSAIDADGVISGDATGTIDYANGIIRLTAASVPNTGTGWSVEYTHKNQAELKTTNAVPANTTRADIELLAAANCEPGSISFFLGKAIKKTVVNGSGILLSETYLDMSRRITDNGDGWLIDRSYEGGEVLGTINYVTGEIVIDGEAFLKTYTSSSNSAKLYEYTSGKVVQNRAEYSNTSSYEVVRAHNCVVSYQLAAGSEQTVTESKNMLQTAWRFAVVDRGPVVPGSVILQIASELFFDNGVGGIVRSYSTTTGVGATVGSIDYNSAECVIENYEGRPLTATVTPLAVATGNDWAVLNRTTFRTSAAPLRPNGFNVRADNIETSEQYNGQADNQGVITGDGITGEVDLQKGLAEITFPAPVLASTVYYNAVSYKQIPLNPDILGLDPVRLPSDGRVPILRDADILVITHTKKDLVTDPEAGLVVDAERDRLHDAWFEDSLGTRLDPEQYTLNKAAGTATLATPFVAQDADSNALVGDLYFVHRIDDMALCTEARIDGTLQLAQPLYHDFPADETWVASAVYLGNLRGRVKDFGCYATDPGYGSTGTPSNGQYNLVSYPIAIDNRGSVPERWKIIFTSTTAFRLLGEHRGQVATGSTAADFSPLNPQSGTPFFTIESDGWGGGWATGNTVVFETEAAAAPLWLIRTVLPGQATVEDDSLKIELRGDHN